MRGTKASLVLLITALILQLSFLHGACAKSGPLNTFIVYKNTPTGNRFRQAIEGVIASDDRTVGAALKVVDTYAYSDNDDGVNAILAGAQRQGPGAVDLVLGPTESDLFVALAEKRSELDRIRVPIVSSQITVKLPIEENGWLFRTNVSAGDRATRLAHYLNKFWASSVVTLYADTEFGRSSEYSFRKAMVESEGDRWISIDYKAFAYQSTRASIEEQLQQIHKYRPEVVAIFGEREELPLINRIFRESARVNYSPLFVTNLDARSLAASSGSQGSRSSTEAFDNLIFVSLSEEETVERDDVVIQAQAMTLLIGQIYDRIVKGADVPATHEQWRTRLRTELRAALQGNVAISPRIDGLLFRNNENVHPMFLHVLNRDSIDTKLEPADLSLIEQVRWKYDLIKSRFGFWPLFNIVLMLIVTFYINWRDVREWHKGSVSVLLIAYPFWLLFFINSLITISLYVVLSETGAIKYGNPVTALIVALTPAAFLSATFFNTEAGKSLGLKEYYESFLRFVYRRMMYKRYLADESIINIIAYSNPASRLKRTLCDLYENATNDSKLLMEAKIQKAYEEGVSWRDKRRILARLVYSELKWKDIWDRGLIPPDTGVDNRYSASKKLKDPEVLLTKAAREIVQDEHLKAKLDTYIEQGLQKVSLDTRRGEIEQMLEEAHDGAISEQDFIERKLHVWIVLYGYSESRIHDEWLKGTKSELVEVQETDGGTVSEDEDLNHLKPDRP